VPARATPGAAVIIRMLHSERESRRARAREMFARVAGFPAIETLDQYDFGFATGAPRKHHGTGEPRLPNTRRPHSALGYRPPAPLAIRPEGNSTLNGANAI
jgi:hypothetical protein